MTLPLNSVIAAVTQRSIIECREERDGERLRKTECGTQNV